MDQKRASKYDSNDSTRKLHIKLRSKRKLVWYHWNRLVEHILNGRVKTLLTEFGINHRWRERHAAFVIILVGGIKYRSVAASPELEGAHDVDSSGRDAVTG